MAVSFVVTAPEVVTAAAGNLAGIGSSLGEATAAAAAPTTGLVAAAADEVSLAISRLFGTYGQEFQALSSQAAAFHDQFVSLLNGGAEAYVSTELANAGQTLANTLNAPAQTLLGQLSNGGAAAAAASGGAYQQLFANTNTNLEALFNAWAARPFPIMDAVGGNWLLYSQEIANAFRSLVANFPANLANLPAAIQAGIQGLVNFPWAYYTQQFVTTQIAFAQSFLSSMNNAATGIVSGLPAFGSGLQTAFQTALAGNYYGAVQQAGTALGNLLITGFDTSNYTIAVNPVGFPPVINITATAFPVPLGPLPDFFKAVGVIGQDAQYLTNLMPPGIPRQISQNLTNVINTVSNPSIEALATLAINTTVFPPTASGTLSGFFGLPIVLTYASLGAPLNILYGSATVATSAQQALLAGNYLGALGTVIDAPAVVTNAFLNGQVIQDVPIPVPSGIPPLLAPPLPTEILVTLHLPFSGILVPPHYATATVTTNATIPIPGFPLEGTIFGTPFMGLAPLLINYVPQQIAQAIKLPA
jgi:PE family